MFERLLLIKLRDEHADDASRARFADAVRAALSEASEIRELRVGIPADEDARRSWDVFVRTTTESESAYGRAVSTDAYRRFEDEVLSELALVVKGWGFELS